MKIVVLWRARITMQQWRLLIYCARTKVFAIFIIISNESNEKGAWRQDDSSYLSLRILYTTLSFELLIATIKFTKRFFPWNSILESFRSPICDTKSSWFPCYCSIKHRQRNLISAQANTLKNRKNPLVKSPMKTNKIFGWDLLFWYRCSV